MVESAQHRSPGRRIGFVGSGGVAGRHARVLASLGAEVAGVTDIDPRRARRFADEHGGRAVPDAAAVAELGVDAVYVCVPPAAHGEPERAVAAAGVPMFVEKPLGADLDTAEQVAAVLAATPVPTRVGHHWRCAEPVRRARELLRGRQIRLVSGWWLDTLPPVAWWRDRRMSGGPLVEQAVHVLDLARVLAGEVVEVHAASAGPVEGGTADVASAAVLRFATGAVGTVATTCALAGKHRAGLEIVADGLVVGVGEDWLEVGDGTTSERAAYDPMTARTAADREFLDVLHGAGPAPDALGLPDHGEALRSHRLACALARSLHTGTAEAVA
jgi:myo-inositol 2-dehydrogenase / D-chiro-inositol 1-dehydrogenase